MDNIKNYVTKQVIRKRAGQHQRYASGFQYQQDSRYFAQIADNLSEEGVKELDGLGAKNIESAHSGIYFNADKSVFYKINYMSRLISRVLAPLESFPCDHTDTLYKNAKKIRWELLISLISPFCNILIKILTSILFAAPASLSLNDQFCRILYINSRL
ncbi:MAG: hypothetical protein HQK67_06550, partial [Desulfamplus sp.]|nr:hypothetical protein [Desulfamplus sp.]